MAKREELKLNIVADDKASQPVQELSEAVDKLDGRTAEVAITAEDRATAEVQAIMTRISGLADDEKKVILSAEAKKLQSEVDKALILLGKVDGEEAVAILDAKNNAQNKLADITTELNEIDGRIADATADVTVGAGLAKAKGDLDALDGRTTKSTVDASKGAGLTGVEGDLKEIDGKTYKAEVDANVSGRLSGLLTGISAMPGNIGAAGSAITPLVGRGGVFAALAGLVGAAAVSTADMATDVQSLATLTGEDFSYVDKFTQLFTSMSGLSTSDLLEIIAQANETLANSPDLQALLGVTSEEFASHPLQSIIDIIGTLQTMAADERLTTMFKVFGEEGAKQLAPLIASGQDLSTLIEEMPTLVTPEDAATAREVQAAFRDLKTDLREIGSTLGEPLLRILEPIASLLSEGSGLLAGAFDPLADLISGENLREADFSDEFYAFLELVRNGTPQLEAWQTAMGSTGDSFSTLEDQISTANRMIEQGIPLTEVMGEVFGASAESAAALAQVLGIEVAPGAEDAAAAQQAEAEAAQAAADAAALHEAALQTEIEALEGQVSALEESSEALGDQADAYGDLAEATIDQEDAEVRVRSALDKYNAAVTQSGESSAEAAEAARDLRDESIRLAAAKVAVADAAARQRGATLSATEAIDIENNSLISQAATLTGPARQAILDHVQRLNGIPEDVQTQIDAAIEAGDIPEAERLIASVSGRRKLTVQAEAEQWRIDQVERALQFLTRTRNVTVNAHPGGGWGGTGWSGWRGATGNPFTSEGRFLVGEQGPELVDLPTGAAIHGATATSDMMRNGGGGGPQTVVYQTINVPFGSTARDVAKADRRYTRIQGPS